MDVQGFSKARSRQHDSHGRGRPFVTRPSKCGIADLGAGLGLGHGIRAVLVPVITVVAVFQTLFFALGRYLRGISVNNKFTCKT